MIPGSASQFFLGASQAAGGATGFQVSRSLRYSSVDSSYCSRTFAAPANNLKWTWSGWVKRGKLGTDYRTLFNGNSISTNYGSIEFNDTDNIRIYNRPSSAGGVTAIRATSAVYRDPSAWYHIMGVWDSANATAADRLILYVNGVRVTSFSSSTDPTPSEASVINSAIDHAIGRQANYNGYYFDGLMASIYFIDGQALTPSSFTEVSATTGQLIPKAYTGTYGLVSVAAATGALPIFNTTDTYGAAKGSGTRTDASSSSIVLALPMDGTNGGTSFGDQSATIKGSGSAKTITVNGNTNTSTAQSKFYGSSGYFDGTGDWLSIQTSSDFSIGTGDNFTFEAFINPTSVSDTTPFGIGSNAGFAYRIISGSPYLYIAATGGILNTGTIPAGAWTHIAITRNSGTLYSFINGTLVGSVANSGSFDGTQQNFIGAANLSNAGSPGYTFTGYIQDVRFYKGVAKYTSSFSPVTTYNNSFYLQFADNSSNTASTLGKDTSPNGNNWNPVNFSITSGTGRYIPYVSNTGTIYSGSIADMFDGSTSNLDTLRMYGGTWTLTPSPTITVSSSIRVMAFNDGSGRTNTLTANSTSVNVTDQTLSWRTITLPSYPATLTSLSATAGGSTGNDGICVSAIEIDGVILTDKAIVGPGNDSLVDTPTSYGTDTGVGGSVRGNYCTWNPLNAQLGAGSVSNGNLDFTGPSGSANYNFIGGTFAIDTSSTSGWYFEFTQTTYGNGSMVSLLDTGFQASALSNQSAIGYSGTNSTAGISYANGGEIHNYGSTTTGLTSWTSSGDIISIAIKNNKIWFAKNGTWISGSPSAETSPSITLASTKYVTPAAGGINSSVISLNAGQRAFAYTAPSGFKALCDTNLPAPVVAKSNTVFDVVTYNGSASPIAITLPGGFSPDLVWLKCRSNTNYQWLTDTIRGTNKQLTSNDTIAEESRTDRISSFDASGFTVANHDVNSSGQTFVGWAWDAGTTTVSNSVGSITSQVRANATAGFSVVTGTTPATNTFTIGHGLNTEPYFIIVKVRNQAYNWDVYHKSLGNTGRLVLNSTNANSTTANAWGSTTPTSSVFTMGGNGTWYSSGDTFVAYCFSPVVGYSNFGSYVGNGSGSDGPFVYTGFRPRFLMVKRTDNTTNWFVLDTARNTYNAVNSYLMPNSSSSEDSNNSTVNTDFLSNGFKLRATTDALNASGGTYVYACFAESPFAYSRAR